jgi:non-specific serine/threonine protein kinase
VSLPDNNLPLQLTDLVGRRREISEVARLLAEARLLTLTGPGGSGKTRLALAVASELAEEYEDGVWLVELASLSDPELVPQALASVLGVREAPDSPLTETLSDHLQYKTMLLVLDNCEHLIDTSASLAEALLRRCPDLSILATSREALSITGESSWPVPPLSLPDPRRLPTVDGLLHYEAARLFVERAKALKPGFEVTEGNAMALAQVCYRLDGMPLAIELAAARTKVLPVEQILGRLEESLRLLSAGGRTAMLHHRTLRATMDWSHALLDRAERTLFRRLSVFAGGFRLEAAEAVGSGEGIEEAEVLDLLTSLVDKSLVLVLEMAERDDATRYRLLETVRQYAREKLEESAEETAVRRRQADFFVGLSERAAPELKGHGQVAMLEILEREHDNLRAAVRFMLDTGDAEAVSRLAWALWFFWRAHGHQAEWYRYTGEALEEGESLSAEARARLLCVRGVTSYGLESIEGTEQLWEWSAVLFRQTEDGSGLAMALGGMALMALARGEMERSTALFEEGLGLYREAGNEWGAYSILAHLGLIPLGKGDYARAARYFEEALEGSRELGDRLISSIALHNLAWTSRLQGDHERAARLYKEGLGIAVELGDEAGVAYCLEGLASLSAADTKPKYKVRLFGASEAILESVGTPLYVQIQDRAVYDHAVEELRSHFGEEAFEVAWAEGRAMAPEQAVGYALQPPNVPEQASPSASFPAGLSPREVEVLRLVARGMTNARIAQELFISPRTVNGHLTSAYHKMGTSTRTEAARFASEHGLL